MIHEDSHLLVSWRALWVKLEDDPLCQSGIKLQDHRYLIGFSIYKVRPLLYSHTSNEPLNHWDAIIQYRIISIPNFLKRTHSVCSGEHKLQLRGQSVFPHLHCVRYHTGHCYSVTGLNSRGNTKRYSLKFSSVRTTFLIYFMLHFLPLLVIAGTLYFLN